MPFVRLNASGYKSERDSFNLINYIIAEDSPIHHHINNNLIGGSMIYISTPDEITQQMLYTKKKYNKCNGCFMRHLIISPNDQELQYLTLPQLYNISMQICNYFMGYQTIFAIHQETGRPHVHLAINSVSFLNGKKIQINLSCLKKYINELFLVEMEKNNYNKPILKGLPNTEYTELSFEDIYHSNM